ncbi:MAG: hypothetical protein HS117_07415 [Verrucomicrobiaceae bacterium]|nr:hypothetical protein [Verrucomicrobiaceae bacterium]
MKSPPALLALSAALLLIACDKPQETVQAPAKPAEAPKQEAKPVAEETKDAAPPKTPEPEKPVEDPTVAMFKNAEKVVDVGAFGTDQRVERADMPQRGIIIFGREAVEHAPREHWEQWDWKSFKARRWGRYAVRLTYTMKFASLQTQFRFGTQALKEALRVAPNPTKHYLGEIYIDKPGDYAFSLFAPASGADAKLDIHELAFIPAPEGPMPKQLADGSILLEAKTATTWSENMRYEPKPEKNCLGFWTSEDDFAEWEFEVVKPGKFTVSVFYGCDGGNHGSAVALKAGGKELTFTTEDTGGFQSWREAKLGEIELGAAGKTRLTVDPVNKVKSAVLDVQKVVLTPAG